MKKSRFTEAQMVTPQVRSECVRARQPSAVVWYCAAALRRWPATKLRRAALPEDATLSSFSWSDNRQAGQVAHRQTTWRRRQRWRVIGVDCGRRPALLPSMAQSCDHYENRRSPART